MIFFSEQSCFRQQKVTSSMVIQTCLNKCYLNIMKQAGEASWKNWVEFSYITVVVVMISENAFVFNICQRINHFGEVQECIECLVTCFLYSLLGFWFGRRIPPSCHTKTTPDGSNSSRGRPWSSICKISSSGDCVISDTRFDVFIPPFEGAKKPFNICIINRHIKQ